METNVLESQMKGLDSPTISTGNQVKSLVKEVRSLENQVYSLTQRAERLQAAAASEENPDNAADLLAKAQSCITEAGYYKRQANEMHSQISVLRSTLISYSTQYKGFIVEAQRNMESLNTTISRLHSVSGSYGNSQISAAMSAAQSRVEQNRSIVEMCNRRVAWINTVVNQ